MSPTTGTRKRRPGSTKSGEGGRSKRSRLNPEARRDHLIRTAMTVFKEQGIAGTSVLQVTQAAGVSNGTFYRYFEDKEQLECAIGAIVLTELGRTLEEMQRDENGAERIAIGAFGAMRTVGANHEVGSILAEYFERGNALLQGAAVQLADHIREGRESGEFPVDAPSQYFAGMFFAMFGVGARSILAGQDPDEVGEFIAAGQLRLLGVARKRADSVTQAMRRRMGAWQPMPLHPMPDQTPQNPAADRE
ncbi:MAG: TetR/AcrR family transcriptional regulator [Solirubrobacterales bacterium]